MFTSPHQTSFSVFLSNTILLSLGERLKGNGLLTEKKIRKIPSSGAGIGAHGSGIADLSHSGVRVRRLNFTDAELVKFRDTLKFNINGINEIGK